MEDDSTSKITNIPTNVLNKKSVAVNCDIDKKDTTNKPRKLVLFVDSPDHFKMVQRDLDNGWHIVNIAKSDKNYICILEKDLAVSSGDQLS